MVNRSKVYPERFLAENILKYVPRLRKAAPLAEMYAYVRKEREEHKHLKLD